MKHMPVLVEEVVAYLALKPGERFVDATLDGGGHTREILARCPGVQVLGIEWDPDEVRELKENDPDLAARIEIVNDSYVHIAEIAKERGFAADAILFDLGVSSWHYAQSGRGFSFKNDEPLDMRFNPETNPLTAALIVNTADSQELERILVDYGEEQFAHEIASAITHHRRAQPIRTTHELVMVVEGAVPAWYKRRKIHCATKTFQALRIAVNAELENVRTGVASAIEALKPGGRLAVISFQGGEDKIVRELFKAQAKAGTISWVTRDTIKPAWEEIKSNPRARSAKMKIIQKITPER